MQRHLSEQHEISTKLNQQLTERIAQLEKENSFWPKLPDHASMEKGELIAQELMKVKQQYASVIKVHNQ